MTESDGVARAAAMPAGAPPTLGSRGSGTVAGVEHETENVVPFPSKSADERPPAATAREAVGAVLRSERQAQQRTLADVAEQAAVSLPYLSEVERGRKDVSSELLTAIADSLDLPLPVVFDRVADRLRARGQGTARMQLLAA